MLLDAGGDAEGWQRVESRKLCGGAAVAESLKLEIQGVGEGRWCSEGVRGVVEGSSGRGREKARKILEVLRVGEKEDGEEVDWEAVMKVRVTRARQNQRNSV